ncbi:MAG TPA: fused MFS/spermidine synthase, partial [Gemmataceae bacterium]|nr:fused MFS/spermidine synthase [Gemmataceae bacterium]
HYELARDRPGTDHLTEYFLLMSVGGVLGGLFNALFAPLVFPQDYEYKLALVFACFLVPQISATTREDRPLRESAISFLATAAVFLVVGGLCYLLLAQLLPLEFRYTIALIVGWTLLGCWAGVLLLDRAGQPESPPSFITTLAARVRQTDWPAVLDAAFPFTIGVAFLMLLRLGQEDVFLHACSSVASTIHLPIETVLMVVLFAVPVMICFFFVDRPIRFGLCVAVLLGMDAYREYGRGLIYSERSFFGILKIEENKRGWHTERRLVHGTTLHGTQIVAPYLMPHDAPVAFGVGSPWDAVLLEGSLASFDPRQEPLTYYHRTGPVGAMFQELRTRKGGVDAKAHVAMVGLGTGSVSCYALSGQKLTFYEIDPAVKRLVADTNEYFTFVTDARNRGAILDFHMGDARLKLKEDVDARYSLLLVDAFSSDSIPVHLLTREAVQLYFDRMPEDGILALHISNKYVRLEPVVARIADDLGLAARVWNDDAEGKPGKTASSWVVLAKKVEYLGTMAAPQSEQVAKFVDPSHPLLEMYRKHGGQANLMEKIKEEYGDRGELTIELLRQRNALGLPMKWMLKFETTSAAEQVQKLRTKYGGQAHLRTVIEKKADEKVENLTPLLSHGESLTLDNAWEHVGGKRIDLLREWIAKYAAADPEPVDEEDPEKAKQPKSGTGLGVPLLFEFGPRFVDLALLAARLPATVTIEDALRVQHGPMFRELQLLPDVPTWTDDYSDVLRVMMIPELQKVRKFFGLPTPVEK